MPVVWEHRAHYERDLARVRAALTADAFAAAWVTGRSLVPEQAIAEALSMTVGAASEMPTGVENHGLSPRELEFLRLIADGLSDRAVAETLFIGQGTVRSHLTNIFGKLAVGSRTAAIAAARRLGLL